VIFNDAHPSDFFIPKCPLEFIHASSWQRVLRSESIIRTFVTATQGCEGRRTSLQKLATRRNPWRAPRPTTRARTARCSVPVNRHDIYGKISSCPKGRIFALLKENLHRYTNHSNRNSITSRRKTPSGHEGIFIFQLIFKPFYKNISQFIIAISMGSSRWARSIDMPVDRATLKSKLEKKVVTFLWQNSSKEL